MLFERNSLKMKDILSKEIILIVALVCLHLFIFESGVGGADGWSYFANTASIAEDFDLNLSNNRIDFPQEYRAEPYMEGKTIIGLDGKEVKKIVTHEALGTSIMDVPFYLLGTLVAKVTSIDFQMSRIPYSRLPRLTRIQIMAVVGAHNLYTLAGVILLFLAACRLGFSRRISFLAAIS